MNEPDQQIFEQQVHDLAQHAYGDFMLGPQADSRARPSQQRPEWVEYMLSTMRGYVDTGVAGLRTEMISRFDTMQLSIDEIHRAVVHPTQPFDPSHSHVISGNDADVIETTA